MTSGAKAWLVVALLWGVALLNYLDRQVIFSLFPLLREDLHLTDPQLGLLGAAFLWVYGVTSPVAGWVADRWGCRPALIASLAIWSAITGATGFARSVPQLLSARAAMGVSEACYLPAALAMIARHHGEKTRSRATGIHYSGIYAGVVLGGVGGGWMGQHYGWRVPFLLLGAVGVVYSVVLWVLLPREADSPGVRQVSPRFLQTSRALLSTPGFTTLLAVFAAKSVADWLVYTWMPLYLYERFHLSLTSSGFAAAFSVQGASVAGILLGGWLADRWAARSPRGRLGTQALGLAAAAPFLIFAGMAQSPWVLLGGLGAFGVGRGMNDANGMPVLCQFVRPEWRATGYGLLNCVGTLAGGFASLAAGAGKAAFGLGLMLQLAGLLLFAAALLLWRLPVPAVAGSGADSAPQISEADPFPQVGRRPVA